MRGKWVELDREKLREVLGHWEKARRAARDGLSFREAMRLLAGTSLAEGEPAAAPEREADWSRVVAGEWLATTLARLRGPEALAEANPAALRAVLRPYQQIGVRWLSFLSGLRPGRLPGRRHGAGEDDPGAGAAPAPEDRRRSPRPPVDRRGADRRRPSLLVVPASLIANWQREIERFAPDLSVFVAHPSERPGRELAALAAEDLADTDLVITTYGQVPRLPLARRGRVGPGGARRGSGDQESRPPSRRGRSSSSGAGPASR